MKSLLRKLSALLLVISVLALFTGCVTMTETIPTFATTITEATTTSATSKATSAATASSSTTTESTAATSALIDEAGAYTHKDEVALYIYTYGRLPSNFITKKEAKKMGWSSGGLDNYIYGGCIGGDKFGNYEENLPEKRGRTYYECDIDTMHRQSRGAKRIVFSSDGLIYYTEDHYSSFELLYGSP